MKIRALTIRQKLCNTGINDNQQRARKRPRVEVEEVIEAMLLREQKHEHLVVNIERLRCCELRNQGQVSKKVRMRWAGLSGGLLA